MDYYDVFNSCLNSHPDGTHSLQSDVMLHFSRSVLVKKPIHLYLGWPEGLQISFLGEPFL